MGEILVDKSLWSLINDMFKNVVQTNASSYISNVSSKNIICMVIWGICCLLFLCTVLYTVGGKTVWRQQLIDCDCVRPNWWIRVTLEYDRSKGKSNTDMGDGEAMLNKNNCSLFFIFLKLFLKFFLFYFFNATFSFIVGYLCESAKSPGVWGDGVDMVACVAKIFSS